MAALGCGGVVPPDSSSGLCVDAELYKSITSYKSDDIDQLCYTHTSSRQLTGLYNGIRWQTKISLPSRDLASFSAIGPVVGTSLATSFLTAAAGFGVPEACACGCGGQGGGSIVGNGGVGSCLLASHSL
jgi:hypothetical protein